MSLKADQIRQQNLDFIYGKNKDDAKFDLDKRSFVKSAPKFSVKCITSFVDEYLFLSPSYSCQVQLCDEFYTNKYYPSFEHALQASKFNTGDTKRDEIRRTIDIKDVKRIVTSCSTNTQFQESLEKWKSNCLIIGEKILRDKFFRNKQLKSLLMKTKQDEYEQFHFKNTYNDTFWGLVEPSKKSIQEGHHKEGEVVGTNHLGKLLLKIREEIYSGDDTDNWIQQNFEFIQTQTRMIDKPNIHVLCYKQKTILTTTDNDTSGSVSPPLALDEVTDECKWFRNMNVVFLGKTDESNYIAAHPSISRVHGAIAVNNTKTPAHMYYVDLGSSNGSLVALAADAVADPCITDTSVTEVSYTAALPFQVVQIIPRTTCLKLGASSRVYKFDIESNQIPAVPFPSSNSMNLVSSISSGVVATDKSSTGIDVSDYFKAKEKETDDQNTVFVSKIPEDVTQEDLILFFSSCGKIKKLSYPVDKITRKPRGIAFVTFDTSKGLFEAINCDGDILPGCHDKIRIRRSNPAAASATASSASAKQINNNNLNKSTHETDQRRMKETSSDRNNQEYSSHYKRSSNDDDRDYSRTSKRARGADEYNKYSKQENRSRSRRSKSRSPRRRQDNIRDNSNSPPRRRQDNIRGHSNSPPRKRQDNIRDNSNSPPRRRQDNIRDNSNSPPRRRQDNIRDNSNSPPRRRQDNIRDNSNSPPRRRQDNIRDNSNSPPRRRQDNIRDNSNSPPRRRQDNIRDNSNSPPRRRQDNIRDNSNSPPRRRQDNIRDNSNSPPRRRQDNIRDNSNSPPRRRQDNIRDNSNSPPRRRQDNIRDNSNSS